jgi:tRNA A37 threonylcarbamoyladenosine modification protein TsaB
VISLGSPLLVGVYHKDKLIDSYKKDEKTTEILPSIFDEILKKYKLENLYYAKGPGSFMAIKVSYIFLKTLSITENIKLFATDGFAFNSKNLIKATGTLYFMKENGKISTIKLEQQDIEQKFNLPDILDQDIFSEDSEPLYMLPAV